MRVGGGFTTDALVSRMLQAQDQRSVQFQTDTNSFNKALDQFMGAERRHVQEEHSFLLTRSKLSHSAGIQHFENAVAATELQLDRSRLNTSIGSQHNNTSALSGVDRYTVSSRNKTRLGREQNSSRVASASASRIHSSSSIPLAAGVHIADGSCCAYRHSAQHAAVDGLFVTFCEDTIESKYLDALRRAELEEGQRELDAKAHRNQLAELLGKINSLEQENDELKKRNHQLQVAFTNDTTGLSLLRDAYETKYRDQLALTQSQQATVDQAKASVQELREKIGAQENTIMNQNKTIRELQEQNARVDRSSVDALKRQDYSLMQQNVLLSKTDAQSQEITQLKETLRSKDMLIDGMQKELNAAYGKINSIAILRDQVKRASSRNK